MAPTGEAATERGAFVRELYAKGVTEETTQLVVSNGRRGSPACSIITSYDVLHQGCIFHEIKNLADRLQSLDLPPAL